MKECRTLPIESDQIKKVECPRNVLGQYQRSRNQRCYFGGKVALAS